MSTERQAILIVAAGTVAGGCATAHRLGFAGADGMKRVRIVTEPRGLRGWHMGTPVFFDAMPNDGDAFPCLSDAMVAALNIYVEVGRMRRLDEAEARQFVRGVA